MNEMKQQLAKNHLLERLPGIESYIDQKVGIESLDGLSLGLKEQIENIRNMKIQMQKKLETEFLPTTKIWDKIHLKINALAKKFSRLSPI